MGCKHLSPPVWCGAVKNDTAKPYRIWFECPDCGAHIDYVSQGPANERIPRAEKWLAEEIAAAHLLWQRGKGRTVMIANAVNVAARWR